MEMSKFRTKMLHLSIFRREFENDIVIFDISILQFVLLQGFVQK